VASLHAIQNVPKRDTQRSILFIHQDLQRLCPRP